MNLISLSHEVIDWCKKTFPNQTPESITAHLKEELQELRVEFEKSERNEAHNMGEELADCVILLYAFYAQESYNLKFERLYIANLFSGEYVKANIIVCEDLVSLAPALQSSLVKNVLSMIVEISIMAKINLVEEIAKKLEKNKAKTFVYVPELGYHKSRDKV